MDKKLITEDIQRMRFMFGYEPGKVISEQQDINEIEGIFSELDPNELEGILDAVLKTEKSDYTHLEKSDNDFEEEDDEVIYEIEVEEGHDSHEVKFFRRGKDYSKREFPEIPKGVKPNMRSIDRDDSITTKKYIDNQIDDFLDNTDLSWLDNE
jgi:hypothetical protein